jgi:hypothetical protein
VKQAKKLDLGEINYELMQFDPVKTPEYSLQWWIRNIVMQLKIIRGFGLGMYGRAYFDLSGFSTNEDSDTEDEDDPEVQEKRKK